MALLSNMTLYNIDNILYKKIIKIMSKISEDICQLIYIDILLILIGM